MKTYFVPGLLASSVLVGLTWSLLGDGAADGVGIVLTAAPLIVLSRAIAKCVAGSSSSKAAARLDAGETS